MYTFEDRYEQQMLNNALHSVTFLYKWKVSIFYLKEVQLL